MWEGMAIKSLLAQHAAQVDAEVEGLCASAATCAVMGADTIRMHEGSGMMIHEGAKRTIGGLTEHKRACAMLESVNDSAASLYAKRCGKSKEEMMQLMAAETWLTPEQAVAMGLADEVISGKSAAPRLSFDLSVFGYRNVPPQYTAVNMLADVQPPAEESVTMTVSYARIAMALGLGDAAEEAAVMSAIAGLNTKLQKRDALLVELRTMTGRQNDDELVGAVRGLVEASAQVPTLKAQLEAQTKKNDDIERAALIAADAADKKGRKLTPALVKLYADKPVAELKAFLEVAPHAVATTETIQEPGTSSTTDGAGAVHAGTISDPKLVTHNGKSWEQLTNTERHNLHFENKELYDAVRNSYLERRRPSAA